MKTLDDLKTLLERIAINDEDVATQKDRHEELEKEFSISNQSLTQLLKKLKTAKPLAIGLDLYRDVSLNPQQYPVVF